MCACNLKKCNSMLALKYAHEIGDREREHNERGLLGMLQLAKDSDQLGRCLAGDWSWRQCIPDTVLKLYTLMTWEGS